MIESVTGCWIRSQVNWRDVQQMFGCAIICLNLRGNDSWMLKLGRVSALILVLLCYQHGHVEIMWIMPWGGFAVQCISFHGMQPDLLIVILTKSYSFFFLHCIKTSFSVSLHIDMKALQWSLMLIFVTSNAGPLVSVLTGSEGFQYFGADIRFLC